ncbi:MAG: PAS domain S-box protein, partial [Syntrophales bacterium]
MDKVHRILILEDNASDADLMEFELEEDGMVFTSRRVKAEQEFIQELDAFSPDIILSDYNLSEYNGAQALAEARKRCPDIPFILVTGAISEDLAIDILTGGAKDYVMKNRLYRLASAVRRALAEVDEHKARKEAENELREAHRDLEARVEERTAQLQAEIQERIRAEKELRQTHELLEAVTKETEVIIAAQDMNFRYVFFNKAYQEELKRLTGKDVQVGMSMVEVFAHMPEQQKVAVSSWSQVLMGRSINTTLEFGDPGRYRRVYKILQAPIRDAAGSIVGAGEVAYDVTKVKQMEKALKDSEERFRSLFNSMTEGFALHEIVCDDNGAPCDYRFLDINPAFERMTGLKREDVISRTVHEVLPNDDPYWLDSYSKVALTGESVHFQNYSSALGRHYDVFAYSPKPGQFAVIFMDITKRVEAEEELRKERDFVSAVLKTEGALVVVLDRQGRIRQFNRACEELTGFSASEVLGRVFWEFLVPPEDLAGVLSTWEEVSAGAFPNTHENYWLTRDGSRRLVAWSNSALIGESGEVLHVIGTGIDITERKQAEVELLKRTAELEDLTQELAAANKELDSFSYSISHDLRTPLRAIDGFSRMILKKHGDKFDGDTLGKFNVIRSNSQMMGHLIDDLLAFSRLGRKDLTITTLDIKSLVRDVWKDLKIINPDRHIPLKICKCPTGTGDQTLIRQVLTNLLSNAVKFTRGRKRAAIEVGGYKDESEH